MIFAFKLNDSCVIKVRILLQVPHGEGQVATALGGANRGQAILPLQQVRRRGR